MAVILFELLYAPWMQTAEIGVELSTHRDKTGGSNSTKLAPRNLSKEVCLERDLVRCAPNSLANQIPVASGVCSSGRCKRAIDLAVKSGPSEYALFELKVCSNNPVHAAMELLGYAACYIAARRNISALGYNVNAKPLLAATVVHFRVLAPLCFYRGDLNWRCLRWLETAIDTGLRVALVILLSPFRWISPLRRFRKTLT